MGINPLQRENIFHWGFCALVLQQHCIIGHSREIRPKLYFGQHQQTKTLQNFRCCFPKTGSHNWMGQRGLNGNTPSKFDFGIQIQWSSPLRDFMEWQWNPPTTYDPKDQLNNNCNKKQTKCWKLYWKWFQYSHNLTGYWTKI